MLFKYRKSSTALYYCLSAHTYLALQSNLVHHVDSARLFTSPVDSNPPPFHDLSWSSRGHELGKQACSGLSQFSYLMAFLLLLTSLPTNLDCFLWETFDGSTR
ncbi:hypothetical protein K456DRAFT_1424365 [Colletotrichum gloeosporioides 23]|nr:hypothetical protein K456DRAFT_1424365 [Colletotrichum gloeosporioides 23]